MKVTIEPDETQMQEILTEYLLKRNVRYLGHEFVDDDRLVVRGELLAVQPVYVQAPPTAVVQPVQVRQPHAAPASAALASHVAAGAQTQSAAAAQPLEGGTRSIVAPDRANLRNGDSGGPRLSLTDMHDVPPPSAGKGEVLHHKQDIHETALAKLGGVAAPLEEMSADTRLDDGGESEVVGDESDDGDFSDILRQMEQLPDNPLKGSGT